MSFDVDNYIPTDNVFYFPVELIRDFLIILNQKLNHYGVVFPVIKWPNSIENWLKDNGIKYNPGQLDSIPTDDFIDLKKYIEDQKFLDDMGDPIITNEWCTKMGFFSSDMIEEASITVKIFNPHENPTNLQRHINGFISRKA